jgi:hypothetical protein
MDAGPIPDLCSENTPVLIDHRVLPIIDIFIGPRQVPCRRFAGGRPRRCASGVGLGARSSPRIPFASATPARPSTHRPPRLDRLHPPQQGSHVVAKLPGCHLGRHATKVAICSPTPQRPTPAPPLRSAARRPAGSPAPPARGARRGDAGGPRRRPSRLRSPRRSAGAGARPWDRGR